MTPQPARLPAQRFAPPTLATARRSPVVVVAAALGLAALVVGVPAALLWLSGPPPVPTSWPTRDTLTRPLDVTLILDILVLVVWLAWLQFAFSVVVEAGAALRGGVLAPQVPLAGPSQRIARALVAAMLLGSVAATQVIGPAIAVGSGQGVPQAVVDVVDSAAVGSTPVPAATTAQSPHDAALTDLSVTPTVDATGAWVAYDPALVGRRVYQVLPPEGRYHDNLWDIAERHLGDGRRYPEIVTLNADRPQPDGRRLELARLIHPGWQLVMPEDAADVPRYAAPPPPEADAPDAQSDPVGPQLPPGPVLIPDQSGSLTAGGADLDATTGAVADPAAGAPDSSAAAPFAGGALIAAGLVGLLLKRRRTYRGRQADDETVGFEIAMRLACDPQRAALVDRGMRMIAASGARSPSWYGAVVDDTALEVLLAPASLPAPAPWETDDGASWRLPATGLPRGYPHGPPPAPLLVGIGRDAEGRDVLVDLDAAGGPVAIDGAPTAAELAAAIAVELSTNSWSDGVNVQVWGLSDHLPRLPFERMTVVTDPTDLLRVVSDPALDSLVSGGSTSSPGRPVSVVVMGPGAPTHVLDALAARAGSGAGLGLVVVGPVATARWRIDIDESAGAALDALGLRVSVSRLGDADLDRLDSLLALAATAPPQPVDVVAVPAAVTGIDDAAWPSSPARIAVLGPLTVRAPGAVDPGRRELVDEIAVYLALHPGGVHPTVLAAEIWPLGVTPDVRDAAIARARQWLGTSEDGSYRLGAGADGRLHLHDVAIDLDILYRLLGVASAAPHERAEATALRRSLRLVRGELIQDRAPRRYSWLARTDIERGTADLVTTAAHRLAEIELSGGDPAGGSEAARAGLRADPLADQCWRDLLRAEHQVGGPPAVAEVAFEMERVMAGNGVGVDPQTRALIEELDPASSVVRV